MSDGVVAAEAVESSRRGKAQRATVYRLTTAIYASQSVSLSKLENMKPQELSCSLPEGHWLGLVAQT